MMPALLSFWRGYGVHALDIVLLAFVFYRLLVLVRGTRAAQVLLGIVVLVLATVAADRLGLNTTTWLLTEFWKNGIVVLVVVFQPEIRSMIAQLGTHRFFRFFYKEHVGSVDEILYAVKDMRRRKMGGLIVLERSTGLKEYIETGIQINGEISQELLLSVFNTKSPMHDGAVIVSGTRVAAAACLLPLSDDPGLSKVLGTRHRAALGLAERSDALVIVVSEETGAVSLAEESRLDRDLKAEELRARLLEGLSLQADKERV